MGGGINAGHHIHAGTGKGQREGRGYGVIFRVAAGRQTDTLFRYINSVHLQVVGQSSGQAVAEVTLAATNIQQGTGLLRHQTCQYRQQRRKKAGIKKLPTRQQLGTGITRVARVFVVGGQQIEVALFGPVEMMTG